MCAEVRMEQEDELEMNKEELQRWITEKVEKSVLISPDLLDRCNMLQSLLEKREKRAAKLLKLWESVAACEATLKKQYSLLGWEWDTDSEDEHVPHSSRDLVQPVTQGCLSPAAKGHTLSPKLWHSESMNGSNGQQRFPCIRNPVVSLTRLPEWKINKLLLPTSPESDEEISSMSDSDDQWEPKNLSRDSDGSVLGFNSWSNKGRKKRKSNEKLCKSEATQPIPSKTRTSKIQSSETKTESAPANAEVTEVPSACVVSASCQSTDEATNNLPRVPDEEVTVNMSVVALRRHLNWQQGKIKEILTKDGRLKYKVLFEDKGKMLVSGHHLAFDHRPKVEQLLVGARVVVRCKPDSPFFCPGVIAEVPCRRNFMRFLVFFDDQTPVYADITIIRLVYQPLKDPLDDIVDGVHRNFVKDYVENWPNSPKVHFQHGQVINAELNGVQQKCEVCEVDCSLIEVVFQEDQHKEWIYRGSMRLEHMTYDFMREPMRLDKEKRLKES